MHSFSCIYNIDSRATGSCHAVVSTLVHHINITKHIIATQHTCHWAMELCHSGKPMSNTLDGVARAQGYQW